jgi:hypothetical protein
LKQHGYGSAEDGAPSKASPSLSGWRQSIWFLRISDSRAAAEKNLLVFGFCHPLKLPHNGRIILNFAQAFVECVPQSRRRSAPEEFDLGNQRRLDDDNL